MRGKQGFRQTRNTDLRVVVAGIDADTLNVLVNTATPAGLNGTNPATIFSGFQNILLPQNPTGADLPVVRLAADGNKFALLSYSPDAPGYTPTTSQIFVSPDAKKWRKRTLPTRDTTDAVKHAWAEVFGCDGRFIVSHGHYPDIVISDNNNSWTLLQNVFAVNSFQQNGIVYGGGKLLAAADNAKVIYRSLDNGSTWAQVASNIFINEFSASPTAKALDRVLALTYGADGTSNVFFMLAKRNDVARFRYVLTSPDGVTWTQRLRIDLGVSGTPQEPLIASSPAHTIILLNNLTTVRTLITTTSAATWTQLTSTFVDQNASMSFLLQENTYEILAEDTSNIGLDGLNNPATNWRSVIYDGSKFVACGAPVGASAAPIIMTLDTSALLPTWSVKLTGTQKLRSTVSSASTVLQPDNSVVLLLQMAGEIGSSAFVDASRIPKTVTATNVVFSDEQSKWPEKYSAPFSSPNSATYLSVAGHPDIAMGTGDFTIEAWIWINSYNVGGALWESNPINTSGYRPNGFLWYLSNEGRLQLNRSGAEILVTDTNIVPLQTWVHVALVRKNNRTAMYVDGQFKGDTNTTFNDTAATGGALISRFCDTGYYGLDGYIGEFRITKDIAQYSGATFTVPTAPFLNYSALSAPTALTTESGYKQLFVSWSPPNATANSLLIDYIVESSTDDGATWEIVNDGVSPVTTTTISNLTNGDNYKFRVKAVTEDDVSPFSIASEPIVVGGDSYFSNVALLLHMDGTLSDSSISQLIMTANGNAQVSSAQSKFGGASGYFDGSSGSYLSCADPKTASAFGTGDFTVEFWAHPDALQDTVGLVSSRINGQNSWVVTFYQGNNNLQWHSLYSIIINTQTTIPVQEWTHIAVTRSSGMLAVYVNGNKVGSAQDNSDYGNTATLNIGYDSFQGVFNGYIDDVRITKGVARYTQSAFGVPAFPYADDGPLSAPTNLLAESENKRVTLSWQAPKSRGFSTIVDYSVQYSEDAGATWNTAADSVSTATTTTVTGLVNNTNYLFRVAAINDDGTGPYATTATPVAPTNGDPFFNSVSLLLRFNETTGTFIDTSPRPKTITANNGGATFNSLSKWGDGSAFFQGGSLTTPSDTDFSFGTGDFTIEFWAYPTADTWAGAILNVGYYYNGILFRQRNNVDGLYLNGSYANWNSQTNMPLNMWTHVALVREAGVVAVYTNGTRVLTWNNAANLNPSGTFVTIGVGAHSGFGEPFLGYLDELRITKGVSRYSGETIDVPTGPFLVAGT
jgi:hypothetical protein